METTNSRSQRRDRLARVLGIVGALIAICALGLTINQIWTIRDNAQRQLRAYVIIGGFRKVEKFALNETPHVAITFDNVGQTPAYDATWLSGINVLPYPMEKTALQGFAFPECEMIIDKNDPRWFFGKSVDIDKYKDKAITDDEWKSLSSGSAAIYLVGRICYRDIFQKTRRTDFCMLWRWDNGRFGDAIACEKGNSGD